LKSLKANDLSSNELTNPIPLEVPVLQDLEELRLTNNKLNGKIPKGISELPKPLQRYLQITYQRGHHIIA